MKDLPVLSRVCSGAQHFPGESNLRKACAHAPRRSPPGRGPGDTVRNSGVTAHAPHPQSCGRSSPFEGPGGGHGVREVACFGPVCVRDAGGRAEVSPEPPAARRPPPPNGGGRAFAGQGPPGLARGGGRRHVHVTRKRSLDR